MPRKGLRGRGRLPSDEDSRCSRFLLVFRALLRTACSVPCPAVDVSHSRRDAAVDDSTCGKTT